MTPLLVVALLAFGQQGPGAARADLATVRALYASAAYDEALANLATIKDASPEQVESYRALCLIALGRTDDATRALERLVAQKPLYKMSDADVSPRLVALFTDVRKRVLPGVAKQLYRDAKASYDAKDTASARGMFTDVLALAHDPDLAGQDDVADLAMLAEGFLKLAEAADAAKQPPPAAPAAAPPSAAEPTTPPAPAKSTKPSAPAIYSVDDEDVVPPGDIERRLPPWDASNPKIAATARRGVLEVVINERGQVESAVLRSPVSPYYDKQLIEAAKKWRFTPATKDGKPVKFRRLFAISLS